MPTSTTVGGRWSPFGHGAGSTGGSRGARPARVGRCRGCGCRSGGVVNPVVGVAAGVASGVLALAAFVQQRWLTPDEIGRWPADRAASETLEAEVVRCLVGVAPYDGGKAEAVRRGASRQMDRVQERVDQSPGRLVDFQEQRSHGRALPSINGFEGYRDERALKQARWHRDRIGHHRVRASWIRRAEVGVSLVGVVLGAVTAGSGTTRLAGWIAMTATVAATFGAHRASSEHERIASSYAVPADLLDRLVRRFVRVARREGAQPVRHRGRGPPGRSEPVLAGALPVVTTFEHRLAARARAEAVS